MGIEVRPTGAACGAEIVGIDVTRPLSADDRAAVEQAFLDHKVLLFRRQAMSPAQLAAFGGQFGVLQPHVQRRYRHPEAPEVVIMANRHPDGRFDPIGAARGAARRTRDGWHSDLSYEAEPAKATLLHALAVPPSGGNTCFADAARAYAGLSEAMKRRLDGLDAEFRYGGHGRNAQTAKAAAGLDAEATARARAIHPAVVAHPVTGRPAIYVNPLVTSRILGVSEAESEAVIEALADQLDQPAYRWEHEWSVGDTLMWENRGGLMHTGRIDYPPEATRRFIRTTVRGGKLTRYRRPNGEAQAGRRSF